MLSSTEAAKGLHRERRERKGTLVFMLSIPPAPIKLSKRKAVGKKKYLTGIRETDSRIRRIVKEGSTGTPLSPTMEFGNSLNEIRGRLVYRLAVVILQSVCLALQTHSYSNSTFPSHILLDHFRLPARVRGYLSDWVWTTTECEQSWPANEHRVSSVHF